VSKKGQEALPACLLALSIAALLLYLTLTHLTSSSADPHVEEYSIDAHGEGALLRDTKHLTEGICHDVVWHNKRLNLYYTA
jgi:hypothetical protein